MKLRTKVGVNYPGKGNKEVRVEEHVVHDFPPHVAKALLEGGHAEPIEEPEGE